ncbi:MAG: hypothetical protein JRE23_00050 [Deltaproteobacteria bacterium]|nr:hypothetical protein [Deltaproteobacteria bacterium]
MSSDLNEETYGFMGKIEVLLNEIFGFPKGSMVLKRICNEHYGEQVKVPHSTQIFITLRNQYIKQLFIKNTYSEIAEIVEAEFKEKLSVRQIRRIVHKPLVSFFPAN